ncbi:Ribonuclease BN [uncultured archaeon]|nr:Ribonuclease BN [uncultured archaeon]
MVDILFLGTGGGRFNLVKQLRGTGGFMLLGRTLTLHVDPGPGALLRLLDAGQDPTKTDALIVTHMHVDHVSDAGVLAEAMSGFTFTRRGLLVAAQSVLEGDRHGDRTVSRYHQGLLGECAAFGPNDSRQFEIKKEKSPSSSTARAPAGPSTPASSFHLRGVPVKHDDKAGFGFVLEMDGVKIGYTSDTEYLPGIHDRAYAGLDVLIANNLKSAADGIPDHLHSGDLIKLLKSAKPKLCILSHMGLGLIQSGPEAEAARIESASGVPTIAGKDGYYYCTDRCGWFDAAKEKKKASEEKGRAREGQKKLE